MFNVPNLHKYDVKIFNLETKSIKHLLFNCTGGLCNLDWALSVIVLKICKYINTHLSKSTRNPHFSPIIFVTNLPEKSQLDEKINKIPIFPKLKLTHNHMSVIVGHYKSHFRAFVINFLN